eukprot:TRINITY_DN1798_c0_g1_i1.p1 TRINITY_DN1798_c0_g1~~TRINITY_DN1798_c0_g1_i1.p1  ORF type:complete len:164 (+),score=36.94 TRINITY_DN1798_c0_g1_i1:67-558(+)
MCIRDRYQRRVHGDYNYRRLKMVLMNVLSNCLKAIVNAERAGKRQVLLRPVNKIVIKFLRIMQKKKYVGEFEIVDDRRGKKIVLDLLGRLNKCGVYSPRFDIKIKEMDGMMDYVLPSRQIGFIVLTTTYGIMDHEEALKKKTGGKILGFFYQGQNMTLLHQKN